MGIIINTNAQNNNLTKIHISDSDGEPIAFAIVIPDNDTIPTYASNIVGECFFIAKEGLRTMDVNMLGYNDTSIAYTSSVKEYHIKMSTRNYWECKSNSVWL